MRTQNKDHDGPKHWAETNQQSAQCLILRPCACFASCGRSQQRADEFRHTSDSPNNNPPLRLFPLLRPDILPAEYYLLHQQKKPVKTSQRAKSKNSQKDYPKCIHNFLSLVKQSHGY